MKVAFDVGVPLSEPTGVSRYMHRLGGALVERGVDLRRYQVSLRGRTGGSDISRWRTPARVMDHRWRLSRRPPISKLVGDVDVVHGTNFILPPTGGARGVLTVHDLSFHPSYGYVRERRLSTMVPWSLRRASIVLVPSQAVATEVASVYDFPAERIHVTPEGVDRSFFEAKPLPERELRSLGITTPYALAVGTLQERKNLNRLLDAWARVSNGLKGWSLVLVGPKCDRFNLPQLKGVVLTGWVSDHVLRGLLAGAEMFCYPSLYEGFGLPPLEAMAAKVACLVGDYPAAAEVVGQHALVVNRFKADEIAAGIEALATDESMVRRLTEGARQHAALFTWERTGSLTHRAYGEALSQK